MDEKKQAFWMYPSMVEEIEEMMPEANTKFKRISQSWTVLQIIFVYKPFDSYRQY